MRNDKKRCRSQNVPFILVYNICYKYFRSDSYLVSHALFTVKTFVAKDAAVELKRPLVLPRFTNTGTRHMLVTFPSIKCHDNTFCSFRVISCVQAGGRTLIGAPREWQ